MLISKFVEVDVVSLKAKAGTLGTSDLAAKEMANQFMNKLYKFIGLAFIIYFATFKLAKSSTFIELTGTLASGFEALVPVPQFWSNFKSKSVAGLR